MIENISILLILLVSGGYLVRRIFKVSQGSGDSIGGGCAACSSGTCTPPVRGEIPLMTLSK